MATASCDLLDQGETCCPNCVASLAGIKAQIGYSHPGDQSDRFAIHLCAFACS
jgi:hypothetical protein